jgi:hypothetical protein
MEQLIEAIRAATAADATDEVKATGANACRTILTALEARAGEPLAAPVLSAANPIETAVSVLRGMPAEQLLDLAIARLKAALPPETKVGPVKSLTVPLVPLPSMGRRS